ncbi:DUF2281 domain-containing protein [candidate division KSB1 bacterium]
MELSGFINDFEKLPKYIQRQLIDYAEYLLSKYQKGIKKDKKRTISFNWENGLSDFKGKYTSVDLQHKINELR